MAHNALARSNFEEDIQSLLRPQESQPLLLQELLVSDRNQQSHYATFESTVYEGVFWAPVPVFDQTWFRAGSWDLTAHWQSQPCMTQPSLPKRTLLLSDELDLTDNCAAGTQTEGSSIGGASGDKVQPDPQERRIPLLLSDHPELFSSGTLTGEGGASLGHGDCGRPQLTSILSPANVQTPSTPPPRKRAACADFGVPWTPQQPRRKILDARAAAAAVAAQILLGVAGCEKVAEDTLSAVSTPRGIVGGSGSHIADPDMLEQVVDSSHNARGIAYGSTESRSRWDHCLLDVVVRVLQGRHSLAAGEALEVNASLWCGRGLQGDGDGIGMADVSTAVPGSRARTEFNRALRRMSKLLPGCAWHVENCGTRAQVHVANVGEFAIFCAVIDCLFVPEPELPSHKAAAATDAAEVAQVAASDSASASTVLKKVFNPIVHRAQI